MGEFLRGRYARLDLLPNALASGAAAWWIQMLLPFIVEGSIGVTLLDVAIDYAVPSGLVLHCDASPRRKRCERRTDCDPLRSLSLNQYFGSKRSETYIRTYDRPLRRADKIPLQKASNALLEQIQQDAMEDPDGFDPGLSGREALAVLQCVPSLAEYRPSRSILDFPHRVEGSVRPRLRRRAKIFDRRPEGLLYRIKNPFKTLRSVHLGALPRDFWRTVFVGARLSGLSAVLAGLGPEAKAATRQVMELRSVEMHASGFFPQASKIFDEYRGLLQTQIDGLFAIPGFCAKPLEVGLKPQSSPS